MRRLLGLGGFLMVDFPKDTFESVHRRKKLAAWLLTLRGPARSVLLPVDLGEWARQNAEIQNADILNTGRSLNYAFQKQYACAAFFGSTGG